MASLLSSLLRRSSPRLSILLLSSRLSPLLPTSHLFSTTQPPPSPLNPKQVWHDLSSPSQNPPLPKAKWDSLTRLFRSFSSSSWAIDQALSLYIPSSSFPSAVSKFRLFFLSNCSVDTAEHLLQKAELESDDAVHRFLFPIFTEFCLTELSGDLKSYKKLMETADLTKPHTWYPFARAMKRKIVYHCGPTNSGKTYNALCRFMEAKSGVYCSPLRLLAMEVFDKVNSMGVYCSLHTGQEIKEVPFANHVACTVEMASNEELYEVAVIDEVQMMADPTRGFAWTRALLGLKADEIHLCGDPSVLSIVQNICRDTGDELQINRYERFKPLVVEAKTLLGDLRNIRSGDCVVAFSRREIFEVKLAIEKSTRHKCCVIYGALPPETRRQQASLFNNQDNQYDVLVASDAIGMGLNLNIRRVIFYTLEKYNGDKMVRVEASQVKQIAGRAGRRGSVYPDGLVTTFLPDDLEYLIECLKKPFQDVKKVGLFPCFEQIELFAAQFPTMPFNELLDKFRENSRLDGSYFFCKQDSVRKVANILEKVKDLTLKERYNFCFAPVNIRDPKALYHLLRFATYYAQKKPVGIAMGMPRGSAKNDAELLNLETKHQVLSMYLWLSHHFEESTFPHAEKAENMATDIAKLLGSSLAKASWKPQSRQQANKNNSNRAGEEMEEREDGSIEDGGGRDGYQRPTCFVKRLVVKGENKIEELPRGSPALNFVA